MPPDVEKTRGVKGRHVFMYVVRSVRARSRVDVSVCNNKIVSIEPTVVGEWREVRRHRRWEMLEESSGRSPLCRRAYHARNCVNTGQEKNTCVMFTR